MLSTGQLSAASSNEDRRQRMAVMPVAVRHVRAIQEDRIVQQRSFTVFNRSKLAYEFPKTIHVPSLNLHQLLESSEIVGMMRNRMERIRNSNLVVSPVGSFRHHHVRHHASQIGAISQHNQVKEELHLIF